MLVLYDSLNFDPVTRRDVLIKKVRDLLPQRTAARLGMRSHQCPKQEDVLTYSVYTIVYAMFAVTETPILPLLDIKLRRLLLVALGGKTALSSVLISRSCPVSCRGTRGRHLTRPPYLSASARHSFLSRDRRRSSGSDDGHGALGT